MMNPLHEEWDREPISYWLETQKGAKTADLFIAQSQRAQGGKSPPKQVISGDSMI